MYSGNYGREGDRFRGAHSGGRQQGNGWREEADDDERSSYRGGDREVGRNRSQDTPRHRQDMQEYGNRNAGREEFRGDVERMYFEGRDQAGSGRRNERYDDDRESGREGFRGQGRQQDYEYQDIRDGGTQRWTGSQRGRNPADMGDTNEGNRSQGSSRSWMSQGDGFDLGYDNRTESNPYGSRYGNQRSQRDGSSYQGNSRPGDSRSQYGSRSGSQSGYGNEMGQDRMSHAGKGPKGWKRSDDRIREEVNEALARHPGIDASEIEVEVKDGEVTLSGTVADRDAKRMVEDVAECVFGVGEVQNSVRVSRGSNAEANRSGDRESGRQGDTRSARDGADKNSARDGADKNRKGANANSTNQEATAG